MKAHLVITTTPSQKEATRLTQVILKARLAACVHILPQGESHYWWEGKLEKAQEFTLLFKTSKKALSDLIKMIKNTHSYKTPEILAFSTDKGDASYLKWLESETKPVLGAKIAKKFAGSSFRRAAR
jgi:periplasmic divalent cation tolerance protein